MNIMNPDWKLWTPLKIPKCMFEECDCSFWDPMDKNQWEIGPWSGTVSDKKWRKGV